MLTDDERGTLGHIAAQEELASTTDRWTPQAQISWLAQLLLDLFKRSDQRQAAEVGPDPSLAPAAEVALTDVPAQPPTT
jgi:hypothetical protein